MLDRVGDSDLDDFLKDVARDIPLDNMAGDEEQENTPPEQPKRRGRPLGSTKKKPAAEGDCSLQASSTTCMAPIDPCFTSGAGPASVPVAGASRVPLAAAAAAAPISARLGAITGAPAGFGSVPLPPLPPAQVLAMNSLARLPPAGLAQLPAAGLTQQPSAKRHRGLVDSQAGPYSQADGYLPVWADTPPSLPPLPTPPSSAPVTPSDALMQLQLTQFVSSRLQGIEDVSGFIGTVDLCVKACAENGKPVGHCYAACLLGAPAVPGVQLALMKIFKAAVVDLFPNASANLISQARLSLDESDSSPTSFTEAANLIITANPAAAAFYRKDTATRMQAQFFGTV